MFLCVAFHVIRAWRWLAAYFLIIKEDRGLCVKIAWSTINGWLLWL